MRADYVIIGAGSAGCVLANRLSEDPGTKVVLIEAGGRDWNPYIHVPAGFMKMLDHPTLTWGYHAEPDPGTAGRAILYPRGRVLGGSSLDQRADLHPRPARGFRPLGAARQSRLGLGRSPALLPKGRELGGRGERGARQGRPAVHFQDGPLAALRRGHRGRPGRSASNTARTSTICRPAPATASAGASRPAAAAGGPAPPAPICGRR